MSNSNYIRVSLVAESTFGTTPATPSFLVLPTTGQSMRDLVGYQTSQTIRSDRNIKDLVRLTKSSGGGLPCELTYSAMTEALGQAIRAVLCSSGESPAATVASCSTTDGAADIEKAAYDFAGDGFEVGDIVKVTGTATASEDGYYKVTAVATGSLTLEGAVWTGNDASVTVHRAARMRNGTTERSFSVEVARTDIDKAQIFTGCTFDTMSLSVADESITTANFSIVGASSDRISAPVSGTGDTALYVTGATYTEPTEHPVLESLSVPEFKIGGADYAVKSFGITLANNAAARTQIGVLGPQSVRLGSFGASGSFSVYMDSFVDFDDFANNVETDLWFVIVDADGKGWSFSFPKVKFSDLGADTSGLNQEDYETGTVTAYYDDIEDCTICVQRWT